MLTDDQISVLQKAVSTLQGQPDLINDPKLAFFKAFMLSLGARIPVKSTEAKPESRPEMEIESDSDNEGDDEQPFQFNEPEIRDDKPDSKYLELVKDFEVISTEEDVKGQTMPNLSTEPTDQDFDDAAAAKQAALAALENGDFSTAFNKYTEAANKNPQSALLIAGRADVLLKMKRPRAALKDVNFALSQNPDSAKALKLRGQAYLAIGDFANSHKDLARGQQIDYDDKSQAILNKVSKVIEYSRNRDRERQKAIDERKQRELAARKAWQEKQAKKHQHHDHDDHGDHSGHNHGPGGHSHGPAGQGPAGQGPAGGGFDPSGMPGGIDWSKIGGGQFNATGINLNDILNSPLGKNFSDPSMQAKLGKLFSDPEALAAMNNPKMRDAMNELMKNPNYKSSDPEVNAALNKLKQKVFAQ